MPTVDKEMMIAQFHEVMILAVDKKDAHLKADSFLLKMLRLLGHEDVAAAWEEEEDAYGGWKYGDNE
jgi:hypothetical protein